MKKIVTIFLLTVTYLYPQTNLWQWQNPLPQGNYLSDIFFVDTLKGFVVGNNGTIMRTTNGGENWSIIKTEFKDRIIKIFFINPLRGWIMTSEDYTIYQTIDGGLTWDSLFTLKSILPATYYNDLYFVNDSIGYVCGAQRTLKTTNSGNSWNTIEDFHSLNSIFFIDEEKGWTGGSGNTILRTTDGGLNWSLSDVNGLENVVREIQFLDSQYGYIASSDHFFPAEDPFGAIYFTANGGASWENKYYFEEPLTNLHFINKDTGWVADYLGQIFYTSNGGNYWVKRSTATSNFSFGSKKRSWGIRNGNLIVRTTNGWTGFSALTASVANVILWSVSAYDSMNVFACGQEGIIIGSKDGGNHWLKLYDSNNNVYLNGIFCKTQNEIWAVGQGGIVIQSKDGGNNWNEFYLDYSWLTDITFLGDYGFIIGNDSEGALIYVSADGGKTWIREHQFPQITYLDKIKFADSELGWISTDEGILRTTDAGHSWEVIPGSPIFCRDFAIDGNYAWTVYLHRVFFTTNAGSTWIEVNVFEQTNSIKDIYSITFVNKNNGWLCVSDGRIYKTTDSGFTWSLDDQICGMSLFSIRFVSVNNGWAVGTGGTIIHFGSPSVDVDDPDNFTTNKFSLSQNYPNPFNPSTKIKFVIPNSLFVNLIVYDVLGREVATLVSEEKLPGEYEVEFEGNNLSSGVYCYQMRAGDFTDTKKFVLLK
jgi:photosystem II stability/assembly factor-like uncharacterized protein